MFIPDSRVGNLVGGGLNFANEHEMGKGGFKKLEKRADIFCE